MSLMLSYLPSSLICGVSEHQDPAPPPRVVVRMTELAPNPQPDDRQNEDARLVLRMAQGDKAAFAEIYDRFSRPLYATALRVLNDATEAQDVVHDLFITLWEKAS